MNKSIQIVGLLHQFLLECMKIHYTGRIIADLKRNVHIVICNWEINNVNTSIMMCRQLKAQPCGHGYSI